MGRCLAFGNFFHWFLLVSSICGVEQPCDERLMVLLYTLALACQVAPPMLGLLDIDGNSDTPLQFQALLLL